MRIHPFGIVAVVFGTSCNDVSAPPNDPAPVVTVQSPRAGIHDLDSDAMVDVQLLWRDADIDLGGVRLRALDGISSVADGPVELIERWAVHQLDNAGLHVEETIPYLLHAASRRIEVVVPDTAGNQWVDTLDVALPVMELHRTISLGTATPYDAVHCAFDDRLYISGGAIIVVDASTLTVAETIPVSSARVECIGDGPYVAFSGGDAGIIDSNDLTASVSLSGSIGLAWSSLDPEHFYAGASDAEGSALLRYRIADLAIAEFISVPDTTLGREFLNAIAISAIARKIYIDKGEGVRVLDFDSREDIGLLRLYSGSSIDSYDLRLSPTGSELYVAITSGVPRGLGVFSVHDELVHTVVETPGARPIRIAVSPSGTRVFMTTQVLTEGTYTDNYLVAVPEGEVLATFPRSHAPGDARLDSGVTFSRDGRLLFNAYHVFSTGEAFLEVYVNRE